MWITRWVFIRKVIDGSSRFIGRSITTRNIDWLHRSNPQLVSPDQQLEMRKLCGQVQVTEIVLHVQVQGEVQDLWRQVQEALTCAQFSNHLIGVVSSPKSASLEWLKCHQVLEAGFVVQVHQDLELHRWYPQILVLEQDLRASSSWWRPPWSAHHDEIFPQLSQAWRCELSTWRACHAWAPRWCGVEDHHGLDEEVVLWRRLFQVQPSQVCWCVSFHHEDLCKHHLEELCAKLWQGPQSQKCARAVLPCYCWALSWFSAPLSSLLHLQLFDEQQPLKQKTHDHQVGQKIDDLLHWWCRHGQMPIDGNWSLWQTQWS